MRIKNCSLLAKSICVLMCLLLLTTGSMVKAHECSPPRYPTDIRYHNYMKKMVACITYNWSNVTNENLRLRLRDAIGDWEWLDNGHVSLSEVSSASDAYLVASDAWNTSLSSNVSGVTNSYVISANIYDWGFNGSQLYDTPASIHDVYKIVKCYVYINKPAIQAGNWQNHDIQKVWSHEIGHTLGFNETNDGTQSVMRQGRGSSLGWENYWKPQAHDTADLERLNYKSWSIGSVPEMG